MAHAVFFVYFVVDPFSDFRSKKNISAPLAVRVRTVDFSDLPGRKDKDDKAMPMKEKASPPHLSQAEKEPEKKAPPAPDVLKKTDKKPAKPKNRPKAKKKAKAQKPKKDIQEQQKHALDKLSALQKIEQIKKELSQEDEKPMAGSTVGRETGQEQMDFATLQYLASLKAHVNMYWSLPQELADKELSTQVYTEIDKQGRVLNGKILKSSGNEDFDARVLETVHRASPFPPPPTKEMEKLLSKGLVFNFPK